MGERPLHFREIPDGKADFEALYHDLIMEVANKYPGESRHLTAKRYIRERETPNPDLVAAADSN